MNKRRTILKMLAALGLIALAAADPALSRAAIARALRSWAQSVVPALLPFNLAKYAINCVVTFLIYKPVSELLNKSAR